MDIVINKMPQFVGTHNKRQVRSVGDTITDKRYNVILNRDTQIFKIIEQYTLTSTPICVSITKICGRPTNIYGRARLTPESRVKKIKEEYPELFI